jgi:hypothetical protein
MLLSGRILCLIIVIVLYIVTTRNGVGSVTAASASADETISVMDRLWYEFQDILSSHETLDTARALELIEAFSYDPSYLNLSIQGKPLLHQLLNLYWTSRELTVKNALVDVMLASIHGGANVDSNVKGEPDLLTKAFMTRELRVAGAIINSTKTSVSNDANRLWDLYSMNCNPTPLTKLLLHVHTRAHAGPVKQDANKTQTLLRNLLLSAYLDGQSPVIKNRDLQTLSGAYNRLIERLAGQNVNTLSEEVHGGRHSDVYLTEIVESLGDVINIVQDAILGHRHSSPLEVAKLLVSPTPRLSRIPFQHNKVRDL